MGCQRGAGPLVNLRFMGVYTILRVLSIPWNKLTECRRNCPERVSADDFDAVLVRRSLCAWDLLEGVPPRGVPLFKTPGFNNLHFYVLANSSSQKGYSQIRHSKRVTVEYRFEREKPR